MTGRPRATPEVERGHVACLNALVSARDAVQELLDEEIVEAVLAGVPYDVVGRIIGVSKPTMFSRYGSLESLRRKERKG